MTSFKVPFISVSQKTRPILITALPMRILAQISYVAVRGKSDEEGAVQRILNKRRLTEIKDFALEIGVFPVSFVLNWVSKENPLVKNERELSFAVAPGSAQLLDGQHRLEGLKLAMKEDDTIQNIEVPVAIYENLDPRSCADIFLTINEKQKTVSKSLVYDLYGLANESLGDPASFRARDIAAILNKDEHSPYYGEIKFPGDPRKKGGIALSTAMDALKPLVEAKGDLDQIGIKTLEDQQRVIYNFFCALKEKYGGTWYKQSNAFRYASGFQGALDFFRRKIVPYGDKNKSFTQEFISKAISLDLENLIFQPILSGLSGKEAPRKIYDLLVAEFEPEKKTPTQFEM